ncbi:GNAT family N-acetyltransferase [Streptomyces avermitilis]|uniref:GNAT family N-acetyltransferase n=1 Tax=Streptomyces avermitilis TaxID=33903 RepID=UPI0037FB2F8D
MWASHSVAAVASMNRRVPGAPTVATSVARALSGPTFRTSPRSGLRRGGEATGAATAYYQAGGESDVEPAPPDGRSRRRESWMRAVQSSGRTVMCAEREGEVVGILSMGPSYEADLDTSTAGQLYQIHVRPGIWGQGIGSFLHSAFVQFLRDASLVTGVLEAWERNSRAQAFYARHGWMPDGHHRHGPGNGTYVRMRLSLDPAVRPCRGG